VLAGIAGMLAITSLMALGALELSPSNFDKEVFDSGKAAFIKFLAPW
jgi:protein disulfide-isomerase A6